MKHILLFEENRTGATIAIGPFFSQDAAAAWRERRESELDGTFVGSAPLFTLRGARDANPYPAQGSEK